MKLDTSAFRRNRFDMSVAARKIAEFDIAIAEMEQTLGALAEFIDAEERRTHIIDVSHFTYPMIAKAARERSNRLKRSVVNLKVERDRALRKRDRTQVSFAAFGTAAE
jgi:flagellar protein FliJ